MEEGAHCTIRQFSVKPDPHLTPHSCLSPELWDFLWTLEKLEFFQACIAFDEEEEEECKMGESQDNVYQDKFLKRHGGTMKNLNLTLPWNVAGLSPLRDISSYWLRHVRSLSGRLFTNHVGGETDMIVPVLPDTVFPIPEEPRIDFDFLEGA